LVNYLLAGYLLIYENPMNTMLMRIISGIPERVRGDDAEVDIKQPPPPPPPPFSSVPGFREKTAFTI
jgi:hypothetical protein